MMRLTCLPPTTRLAPGALCALALALSAGCAGTRVDTKPQNATVVLDGKHKLGKTPIYIEDQVWLWTRRHLTISKAGYRTATRTITGSANPALFLACLAAPCIFWPVPMLGSTPRRVYVTLQPAGLQTGRDPAPLTPDATLSFQTSAPTPAAPDTRHQRAP